MMPRSRAPYPSEFRQQMVELVRAGRMPEELSREFEPLAQAIRNWVSQADRDEGRGPHGCLRVHRGLVQPAAQAFRPRLSLTFEEIAPCGFYSTLFWCIKPVLRHNMRALTLWDD